MNVLKKAKLILGAAALVLTMSQASHAQLNSNNATVNLNAVLGESLTVSAGPATVNFTLAANGPANGSAPVSDHDHLGFGQDPHQRQALRLLFQRQCVE